MNQKLFGSEQSPRRLKPTDASKKPIFSENCFIFWDSRQIFLCGVKNVASGVRFIDLPPNFCSKFPLVWLALKLFAQIWVQHFIR